jgi:serine/threonine protein phosphatase 1
MTPWLPSNLRIYAIGDVHGRADLLEAVFGWIDADLRRRPSSEAMEILLGDYIDRGPASCAVIDLVTARRRRRPMVCLRGNHEQLLVNCLCDSRQMAEWQDLGARETLISYGVPVPKRLDPSAYALLIEALWQKIPDHHLQFLHGLPTSFAVGAYFFVHAGVRPGIALAEQSEQDLMWIRLDFLETREMFDHIIVHGHTPVHHPDIRSNRINIDTGAYVTGRLTCLVLEGPHLHILTTDGLSPVPRAHP